MFKRNINVLLVTMALCFIQSAFADNASQAINTGQVSGSIDNLIAGYGENWKKRYLFVQTPFNEKFKALAETQTTGKIFPANSTLYSFKSKETELFIVPPKINNKDTMKTEDFKVLQPVEQAIFYTLNATTESNKTLLNQLIFESCLPDPTKGIINTSTLSDMSRTVCNPSIKSIANYNMASLLGPVAYTNDQKDAAKKYVQYASLLAVPLEMPTVKDLEAAKDNGIRYLIFLRTYIAAQAAGLNNLYQMYIARTPVTGLGKAAGMENDDASPLQVEEYAATRRLNPNIKTPVKGFDDLGRETATPMTWRQSIEEASPAQVQREMVYLLAEMRYELYQQRLATERLTAIMSMMQIEQNRQALAIENTTLKSQFEQAKYGVK